MSEVHYHRIGPAWGIPLPLFLFCPTLLPVHLFTQVLHPNKSPDRRATAINQFRAGSRVPRENTCHVTRTRFLQLKVYWYIILETQSIRSKHRYPSGIVPRANIIQERFDVANYLGQIPVNHARITRFNKESRPRAKFTFFNDGMTGHPFPSVDTDGGESRLPLVTQTTGQGPRAKWTMLIYSSSKSQEPCPALSCEQRVRHVTCWCEATRRLKQCR
ncbi:hypothetical protein F4802DRAFT_254120 [Xylaria palmicola]|nr:hypothetical protein F4802DRAFT_254120 [Xylaria palmicola]